MIRLLFLSLAILLSACTDDGERTLFSPPPPPPVTPASDPVDYIDTCPATAIAQAQTISGYACYADAKLSASDMSWQAKPIRYAMVELMDNQGLVLDWVMSGADGYFQFDGSSLPNGSSIYLRVKSVAYLPNKSVQRVLAQYATGSAVDNYLYALASPAITYSDLSGVAQNLVAASYEMGSVFNILDQTMDAQLYLESQGQITNSDLNLIWYSGSMDGSYFWGGDIYLVGMDSDNDAFDDSVILHEYGHFALSQFSEDHSGGGWHSITEVSQDIRLAWSEGFATTFQSMVRSFRGDQNAEWYLDTTGSYPATGGAIQGRVVYEIESTHTLAKGLANEWAVSAVLWDLVDITPGETLLVDGLAENISYPTSVWTVLGYMGDLSPSVEPCNYLSQTVNPCFLSFQDFWEQWLNTYLADPVASAALNRLTDEFSFHLSDDGYELDDLQSDVAAATAMFSGTSRNYTHFGAADEDWIKVSLTAGQSYWLETSNLLSAADTHLYLHDTSANGLGEIANNDDASSDAKNYCSRIEYTATATDDYFIRVDRLATDDWLNHYGAYDFSITVASADTSLQSCR